VVWGGDLGKTGYKRERVSAYGTRGPVSAWVGRQASFQRWQYFKVDASREIVPGEPHENCEEKLWRSREYLGLATGVCILLIEILPELTRGTSRSSDPLIR
jgi:hypothetical protein